MGKRKAGFVIMDDDVLRRIAEIVGPQSAAARALAQAEIMRQSGIDSVVGNTGQSYVVCSREFAEMRAVVTGGAAR